MLKYPSNVATENYPAYIEISIFERKDLKSSSLFETICLPMPEHFTNPSTVSWDTAKLGFVGSAAAGMIKSGNLSGATDVLSSYAKAAGTKLGYEAVANLGAAGSQILGGHATSEDILGAGLGKVANPYLTMMFRGVNFREFDFTFNLVPHNLSECQEILDIVQVLRSSALPQGSGGSGGAGSAMMPYFDYPREFQIKYKFVGSKESGGENKWIHNIKRSALTGISVDYTGAGMWAMIRNGHPVESKMNLKFSEIELVLRDDVMNDGY